MTDRELIAAYVLGELDGPERAELESRMECDPALRSELDATRRLSAGLEALPADAWPEAASGPAPEASPKPAPSTPAAPRPGRRWFARPAFAVTAVAAALVVGGIVGGLIAGGSDGPANGGSPVATAGTVALEPLQSGSSATAVVHVGKDRTVEVVAHELPDSGSSHYYELWLMTDAETLVPVASFGVGAGGAAKVRVPLPANPKHFRYFDISRQAVNGGTGHSTDSVLRGATRSLGSTVH